MDSSKAFFTRIQNQKVSIQFAFTAIAVLWIVFGVELFLNIDLAPFGILPRYPTTLGGVILAPLVHTDFYHLFGNTISLFPLLVIFLTLERKNAFVMLLVGYLGTGLGVWIFGREMGHYGISGFIYFLCAYLIVFSFYKKNLYIIASVSALLVLLSYLFDVLIAPEVHMSWESHSMGAVLGICLPLIHYND